MSRPWNLAFYAKYPSNIIIQKDNDSKHNSKQATTWFEEHGFHVFPWTCYDPACLCPGSIGLSFLEQSGLVQIVQDPWSARLFVRPTFHAVYVACAMAWHMSFFLYPHFGHNLAFICLIPSDPYVLFLDPRFCFISYVWPLCFPTVHLLCTIFIFCFLFQVMHSIHSNISKHVIFLLVLQYGNQLGQASTSILSDLLTSLWPSTLLWPSEIEERNWCRGTAHKLKLILFLTPTSPMLDVVSFPIMTSPRLQPSLHNPSCRPQS